MPDPKIVYELPFGPAVAVFLLLSAIAHLFLATFGYKLYDENVKKGMIPVRYYEYPRSSSVMIVLIGMLVGIYDLGAIILIFGNNAMMNLFGIRMELHLCRQYGAAIQESWSVERLPVWRAGICHPEPSRQDSPGLDYLCRHPGACLSSR